VKSSIAWSAQFGSFDLKDQCQHFQISMLGFNTWLTSNNSSTYTVVLLDEFVLITDFVLFYRNLTYQQLAQMKYILPEALVIKKVLLRDESTCCMKPELQISINMDNIGINMKEDGQNAYLHLRKIFKERLVDFVSVHPEVLI
jgi:ABC-type transport system involved in multi-copper enzyme maturation permease subunit